MIPVIKTIPNVFQKLSFWPRKGFGKFPVFQNKFLKYARAILFGFLALFFFNACSQKKSLNPLSKWMQDNGKIKVLSTIAQIGDLVASVGGERVDGWVLVPADLDPHSYELVKGDGEKISRADLIFYNGLGLEHGAGLSSLLHANHKAAALGEAIRDRSPERILKKDGIVDPHIWMDISLWKKGVGKIAERLSELDPEGAAYYRARAEMLEQKMEQVHAYMIDRLHKVPSEKRFLATSHDAFRYFSRAYLADPGESDWIDRFIAPEGLAPDGQLNPVDIRRTIEFLKAHHISVIFPESNISRDAVAKIAAASRELGLDVRLCSQPLYGDSTSGLSYFEMMKSNADVLAEQLGETDHGSDR